MSRNPGGRAGPWQGRFAAGLALALVATAVGAPRTARAEDTLTLTPSADSYVNSGRPNSNYGTQTTVRVRKASQVYEAFLKFQVVGISGSVTSATLRLFTTDGSPDGGSVYWADNAWTETGLTWNTRPAVASTPVDTAGAVATGTWTELDVTSLVTGDGTISIALKNASTNSVLYSSREGTNPAQLVVRSTGTPPPAPVADFTATPTSGSAPLTVAFSDTSTGSPTSWAWDFQDDGIVDSTLQNPRFTYATTGTYSVRLTVTNAGGSDDLLRTNLVTVSDPPPPVSPVAEFTATPTDGTAPLPVAFSDTSTGSPTSWAWDFQDDGIVDSTLQNPSFTYASPGLYDVRLTVTNAAGNDSRMIADFITVDAPPAPVADFTATPTSGSAPLTVAFSDTSTGSPTSWAWDFQDDGTIDSTAQNPSFTYTTNGTYSVRLTVTGPGGTDDFLRTGLVAVGSSGTSDFAFTTVADAQIKSTSPNGNYGTYATLRVRYTGTEIYRFYVKFTVTGIDGPVVGAKLRLHVADPSADGGSVYVASNAWSESTITWNNAPAFAGGTPLDSAGPVTTGTWIELDLGSSVTGNGTYSFGMLSAASDSALYSSKEGGSAAQLVLTVSGQSLPAPVADFTATPTSGGAPLMVQFTDTSTNSPTSWAWDFQNDGVVDSTQPNASFAYSAAGTYSVSLRAANASGSDTEVRTSLITVSAPPPPGPGDAVLVGAGDIAACGSSGDEATAALLDGIAGTVFTTGDNVYETGTAAEFTNCYEPSWGRHKARTRPTVGNHEYGTPDASGYFGYFGSLAGDPTKGYYSFDLNGWHVVALNSNCSEVGGCGAGSAQETWLRADLAANSASCTVAYWHHPRFSSAGTTGTSSVGALWQALYDDGTELVLNGHAHVYERFAPQTPGAVADGTYGIRQFTVGTGGKSLTGWGTTHPNSEIRDNSTFGVLRVTLHSSGYSWEFVPISTGTFTDVGSGTCHGAPPAP